MTMVEHASSRIASPILRVVVALLMGPLTGCAGSSENVVEQHLVARAAFELRCPESDVELTRVTGRILEPQYKAEGCGSDIVYELACRTTEDCVASTHAKFIEGLRAEFEQERHQKNLDAVQSYLESSSDSDAYGSGSPGTKGSSAGP